MQRVTGVSDNHSNVLWQFPFGRSETQSSHGGSFHKCVLDIAASGLNAGFSLDMFEVPDVLVKVEVT